MIFGRTIARNTGTVFAGLIANQLILLFVTVMLARYLGETLFGRLSFSIVFVGYFAALVDLGTKPIIIREISREREKASAIIGNSLLLKIALAFLAILLVNLSAVLIRFPAHTIILINIMSCNLFLSPKFPTIRSVYESLFQADLSMGYPMLIRVLDGVILAGLVVSVMYLNGSLNSIAFVYVVSAIPGLLLTILLVRRRIRLRFSVDLKFWRWMIIQSAPIAFYGVFTLLYKRIDVLMLSLMKGDDAVGYYSAAYRLTDPLTFISASIVISLFPLMSKYHKTSRENLVRICNFGIKSLLLLALPMCITITVLGERIISLLYGSRYLPSVPVLQILIWGEGFIFLNFFLMNFIIAIEKQKLVTYAAMAMCVVNVFLNYQLIPRWGVVGACFTAVLTQCIGFSIWYSYTHKVTQSSIMRVVRTVVPLNIVFGAWVFLAKDINLLVFVLFSLILYSGMTYLSHIFTPEELKIFRSRLVEFPKKVTGVDQS